MPSPFRPEILGFRPYPTPRTTTESVRVAPKKGRRKRHFPPVRGDRLTYVNH